MAGRGCLIQLLEANYLPGFRVSLFTFYNALKRAGLDIVVLTTDPVVAADRFKQALASKVILLGEEDYLRFQKIRSDKVLPSYLVPRVGKYTFLKFLCFGDHGYDFHVCMDTDLICTKGDFDFSEIVGPYEFAAAPTIGSKALGLPSSEIDVDRLTADKRMEALKKIERLAKREVDVARLFNGGVWYASGRLIGRSSVDALIDAASSTSFGWEQHVLHHFIQSVDGLEFRSLPVWLNFTAFACRIIGRDNFEALQPSIRVLHYNSPIKPWQIERSEADWLQKLWWEKHDAAMEWAAEIVS